MTETATTTRISQIATVFVPVADQDRALEFYVRTPDGVIASVLAS